MMGRTLRLLLPMWAAAAGVIPALAQVPFSLDTSFRTMLTQQNVNSMAVLANGDLLLSGQMRFPGDMSTRYLAKVDTDGNQVASFPFLYGGARITPWNGQYYVSNTTVRRLLPDGLIDPSFIQMNSDPLFNSLQGGDYHVYPDGRILMSGTHTLYDTVRGFTGNYDLIWFSNTGYLDTTKIHRRGNGALFQFKELPNGQFICSGNMTEWEGKQVDWVFRVNADGTPDTTFRSGVYVGGAYAFHGLADGRVYVGGSVVRAAAPNDTLNLVRFLMNGSLDPSFSIPTFSDGGLNGPFIGPSVSALYAWGADRFIAVGQFRFVNGEPRNGICMLDSTGQLLPAFNACGTGTFTFGSLTYASIDFLTVDTANNHIYVCGAYVGYDDGMVNDTQQRFVSRLYGDLSTTVAQPVWIAAPLIQVYPNPANSWVTINYALPASTANAELVVSHVSGRIMEQHMVEGDVGENRSYTLNVSGYAPGFYHLHLVVDGQWVSGCKMVVE